MRKPDHYIFVGITGGVGSGKSTVASMLAEQGAVWVNADRMAQEELDNKEVRDAVVAAFGEEMLDGMGHIDRQKLGRLVFSDAEALTKLEAILHPRVQQRAWQLILKTPTDKLHPTVVLLDIPLLEKSPFREWCDHHIFVDASEDCRLKRVMELRAWREDELARREKRQRSIADKKQEADFVIDNSGSLLKTKEHTFQLWTALQPSD